MLKGLVWMLAHGVYGMTVNKRYWPRYCKGYSIEALFLEKEVGDVYDVFSDMDGHKYKIQCIKDS